MGDIEKLDFEEMDDATKNILGSEGNDIVKEINKNNGKDEKEEVEGLGIHLVESDEISEKGKYERNGKNRGKYKQLSWDDYVKEQKKIYDEVTVTDPINSFIKILNISNREEFDRMFTILKDDKRIYKSSREFEFICTECGSDRFWCLFKEAKLLDVTNAIENINDTFYSEHFRKFIQLDLTGSIPDRNKNGKEFYLHMSKQQLAKISRTLKYFRGKESELGLAICIFTLNRAQEKFQHLKTDKFKVYYQDNGYARIIQKEMEEAAQIAIARLVEGLPILLSELEEKYVLASNKELSKYEERKDDFKYQMKAVYEAILVIEKSDIQVPALYNMEYIVLKEKVDGTYVPPAHE